MHLEACNVREDTHWRGSIFDSSDAVVEKLAVGVPVRTAEGSLVYPAEVPATEEDLDEENEEIAQMNALVDWCYAVAGLHGVNASNMTTSLSDGRVLCLLIAYYHPTILPVTAIRKTYQSILEENVGQEEEDVCITHSDMHR